jgi:hypothetical protein
VRNSPIACQALILEVLTSPIDVEIDFLKFGFELVQRISRIKSLFLGKFLARPLRLILSNRSPGVPHMIELGYALPARTLAGKRIAILCTDGVEQSELTEPRKALKNAGAKTDLVSSAANRKNPGGHP